jgi:hypothetical protein
MKRLFIIFALVLLGATVVQAQVHDDPNSRPSKQINPVGFKLMYDVVSGWAKSEGRKPEINVKQIPGEVILQAVKSERDQSLARKIVETYQFTISSRGGGRAYIERIKRNMMYKMYRKDLFDFEFKSLYTQKMELEVEQRTCHIYHRAGDDTHAQEWLVVIEAQQENLPIDSPRFVMTCLVGDSLTMDDILALTVPKKGLKKDK